MIEMKETLSYDDVLLVPGYSEMLPREADVRTRLIKDIYLNVPVLSAAMDTVTEERMAIALALQGAAGVIHRNLKPDVQAQQVAHAKRYLNWIIESPITVSQDATVLDVKQLMTHYQVSGLPVLNAEQKLVGIITGRDLRFCRDDSLSVHDVMTKETVVAKGQPSVEDARQKFDKHRIEKLPVIDGEGHLTGLITVKDMEKQEMFPNASRDKNGRLVVGAAISNNDWKARLPLLVQAKTDFVVLDTAHGDSLGVLKALEGIKKAFPQIPVVGGNVATSEGARHLIEAGADAVKVGVGPGSICTTRIVSGVGAAQFTAVVDCAEVAAKHDIPVIADGGIKYSGDITKAVAAGADCVMIGNLFAGLKESPGREILFDGRIYKEYRGMGSLGAIKEGSGDRYGIAKDETPVPEGVEGRVPYKGELKEFLHQLVSGLRKGMGYCGCRTIEDLKKYRKFTRITASGLRESHTHDVSITQESPNYSRS